MGLKKDKENDPSNGSGYFLVRFMLIVMGFVFAAALNNFGLLHQYENVIAQVDSKIREEPTVVRMVQEYEAETSDSHGGSEAKRTRTARNEISVTDFIKTIEPPKEKPSSIDTESTASDDRTPSTEGSQSGEREGSQSGEREGSGSGDRSGPSKDRTRSSEEKRSPSSEEEVEIEEEKAQRLIKTEEERATCEEKKKKNPKRMNVAMFYADDWTMKVLGKLDERVKTPNIDAMADNGMIFTNNCVTTSVCWASRSTLATGLYTAKHKHTMPFDDAKFVTKIWPDTLYPLMKKGSKYGACNDGYYTGLFGKWHKLEVARELDAAFDELKIYYGNHYEERDGKEQHVTHLNKIDSIEFLDNWQNKFYKTEERPPFFLTSSFFATHARDGEFPSYKPLNSTRSRFYPKSVEVPTPKTATEKHWDELPPFIKEGEGRTRWRKRFEPSFFQENIKDIYSMATEVDEAVGAIVEKIKSLGVYDNTVLIFTTDNGNMHGEHGLAEKWYPFEESLRVPLVIQDPRMPKERRGTISDAWTLNVDLTPTILGFANIPPSDFMQGRDIADLYLNKDPSHASLSIDKMKESVEWRKDWFYEFNLGMNNDAEDHPWKGFIDASFALVNDEWKYVYWPQHNYEQLFHRSVDPYDEWDLLNKIFRQKEAEVSTPDNLGVQQIRRAEGVDNKNGCCDTVQTTTEMYTKMKQRYAELKEKAQSGERI